MYSSINEANAAVLDKVKSARPFWVDVTSAGEVIPWLAEGKHLLHAGPNIQWDEMTGPMQGACVSACLYEGWAKSDTEAMAMLDAGEVKFSLVITIMR